MLKMNKDQLDCLVNESMLTTSNNIRDYPMHIEDILEKIIDDYMVKKTTEKYQ